MNARPSNLLIADNLINSRALAVQTGISVVSADTSTTTGNIITGVGTGIVESDVTQGQITSNQITNTVASAFWTTLGIKSTDSSGFGTDITATSHIDGNTIRRATTGISMTGLGAHKVSSNTINVRSLGISISAGSNNTATTVVSGNTISRSAGVVTGISVTDVPALVVTGDVLTANVAVGISLVRADDAAVSTNASNTRTAVTPR